MTELKKQSFVEQLLVSVGSETSFGEDRLGQAGWLERLAGLGWPSLPGSGLAALKMTELKKRSFVEQLLVSVGSETSFGD